MAPRSKVDQFFVLERFRHIAAHNPLGQSLDDGGLSGAGFADQAPGCSSSVWIKPA
jgi:hypothetical protein